jgi:hypothetical protein
VPGLHCMELMSLLPRAELMLMLLPGLHPSAGNGDHSPAANSAGTHRLPHNTPLDQRSGAESRCRLQPAASTPAGGRRRINQPCP